MRRFLTRLFTGSGRPRDRVPFSPLARELVARGYGQELTTAARKGGGTITVDGRRYVVLTSSTRRRP